MEYQLTPEIVEILDYIIQKSLANKCVYADELKPIGNTQLSLMKASLNADYKPYIEILENYNLIEISRTLSEGYQIKPKLPITQQFVNKGGFKQLYEEQQKENEHQKELKDLTLKKLHWDSKLSKWQANTFWWVFFLGLIGGISGIISLAMQLLK